MQILLFYHTYKPPPPPPPPPVNFLKHLTLLHLERPKLYGVLAVLSAIGLRTGNFVQNVFSNLYKVYFLLKGYKTFILIKKNFF